MSLIFTAKVISKRFWMKLHKKQNSKRITYNGKCVDRKKITVEIVNNIINKLYECLNPKDIVSEQAGFRIDRFLNTEKVKLLKERFCCAN